MLRTPLLRFARRLSTEKRVGLFGYDVLRSPEDFHILNDNAQKKCNQLCKDILSGPGKSRPAVYLFDDMYNEIANVYYLAECVQRLHTEASFAAAAGDSMRYFQRLEQTLNTSQDLYNALKSSLHTEADRLDEVDNRMINLYLSDFEKSGVQLENAKLKQEFVQLNSVIRNAGHAFLNNVNRSPSLSFVEKFRYRSFPVTPHPQFSDGAMREWAFNKFFEFSNYQEGCLRHLIGCRDRLAKLTGFESYAHRAQDNMLLQDFDSAYQFLHDLIRNIRPAAEEELAQLEAELRTENPRSTLAEWDFSYLSSKIRSKTYPSDVPAQCFSLDSVITGFETIVRNLYGVEFKTTYPDSGELWRGNTQRIDVYRDSQFLGTIYLDFTTRSEKAIVDYHLSLRSSKLLESGEHQTPIAVLSLSFTNGQSSTGPTDLFISGYEVKTVFHEMGHAMHSMLSRTRFQHAAGTRCPRDMAEIPSKLMECFFKSTKVMTSVFENLRLMNRSSVSDGPSRGNFPSTEKILRAIFCLLDLELHGPAAKSIIEGKCTSSDVMSSIWSHALPSVKRNPQSACAHRFEHLVTYGAKFYSYEVAQLAAELIWDTQFEANPFCAEAGKRWAHVQSYGGELPSHKLLEMAIGYAPTSAQLIGRIRTSEKDRTLNASI